MSPVTHLLIGWAAAHAARLERRDRALVAVAGVIPDVDGLGLAVDALTSRMGGPDSLYDRWHHIFCHNLTFALLVTLASLALARRRAVTPWLVFASFHLHLLGDLVGARGPDGYQWPIPYLSPFSHAWDLTWSGQWALNAWPNFAITGAGLALMFVVAVKRGCSPVELVSARADRAFVETVRRRFGRS